MKIGTARTISEAEKSDRRGSRLTAFGSGTRGGGGEGPGGDDSPDFPICEQAESAGVDKSKYIAWFLMMAVGMTFAGLLGAYLMVATNRAAEWKPFDLPTQIWISTAIILASSITYSLAKRGVDRDLPLSARNWFIATTVLGGLFVSSQFVLWIELVNRGFYMGGNPYAGFFYILTAAHLIHVAGGIVALSAILLRSWYPAMSDEEVIRRRQLARSVGWYWHFMGALWVLLFIMLGLWK
jgi:cytochrome c oxidase subunit III